MLSYDFMRRAFVVSLFISVVTPLIGNVIVLRRLSTVGDALSHSSLAGVAIGLCFGINPILGAVAMTVAAALSIELIRRAFPKYTEIATSVVMSVGVGLAAVFSGFVKNAASFNSFLFGSVVAVSMFELAVVVGLSISVILIMLKIQKELLYISFDEEAAKLSGVNVNLVNFVFTILTAVVVAVSARAVGALVISSLMVLPVASAMQVSKSYKSNILFAVAFAVLFTLTGLTVSFYFDLKPGGTIVLIGTFILLIMVAVRKIHGE